MAELTVTGEVKGSRAVQTETNPPSPGTWSLSLRTLVHVRFPPDTVTVAALNVEIIATSRSPAVFGSTLTTADGSLEVSCPVASTDGAGGMSWYVNWSPGARALAPSRVWTRMSYVMVAGTGSVGEFVNEGDVTVSVVSDSTVTFVVVAGPNDTLDTPESKPEPETVTNVPPEAGPYVGLTLDTTGEPIPPVTVWMMTDPLEPPFVPAAQQALRVTQATEFRSAVGSLVGSAAQLLPPSEVASAS